jgi:hypothetical protein
MHYSLACCFTDINANIEAGWIKFIQQDFLHLSKQIKKCCLLFPCCIKKRGNVPFRNYQAMTGADRVTVINCYCIGTGQGYSIGVQITEWADGFLMHGIIPVSIPSPVSEAGYLQMSYALFLHHPDAFKARCFPLLSIACLIKLCSFNNVVFLSCFRAIQP